MPLHYLRKDGNRVLGVWKVTETEEWFKQQLDVPWIAEELGRYSASVRRIEYLAVRMLLKELTGMACRVKHLPSGKPFLDNFAASVSISHTRGYAAVLLDEAGANPGIDIEYYADRVCKIASRFMHPEEWKGSTGPDDVKWLLLHWSAKETLYKILGVDEVDFVGIYGCFLLCCPKKDACRLVSFVHQKTGILMYTIYLKMILY